jgi:hypothetical protein
MIKSSRRAAVIMSGTALALAGGMLPAQAGQIVIDGPTPR